MLPDDATSRRPNSCSLRPGQQPIEAADRHRRHIGVLGCVEAPPATYARRTAASPKPVPFVPVVIPITHPMRSTEFAAEDMPHRPVAAA
jgi:hypothetical protein